MTDIKRKKNFFKKPAWLQEKAHNEGKVEANVGEKKDATQMFARSVGTVSDILAEQKRKEQLRADKQAARTAAATEKEAGDRSRKRRKTSEDGDYEGDRDDKKDSISPRRSTRQASHSSPKSLLKRHEALLDDLDRQNNAILLSDGSDDDATENYMPSKPIVDHRNKEEKNEKLQPDEEEELFPELAAKAREKARKEEQEKKQALKSKTDEEIDAAPPAPVDADPNPTLNVLVWSPIEGTEPLLVKRKWKQSFREIRQAWLQRQPNLSEQQKKDVYFTWRGKKVFDVATCRSLGIKLDQYGNPIVSPDQGPYRVADDQIVLCATTDAQLKKEKEAEAAERIRKEKEKEAPDVEPVKEMVKKLRIYLKSQEYEEVKLSVMPNTLVSRLEGVFRAQNKISENQNVTLVFDGEDCKPEMTMEALDVEDLNMFEVRVR